MPAVQENTVIQTFVSAGSDLAFSGGYGSYYLVSFQLHSS